MSEYYTDDDVTAVARALFDGGIPEWDDCLFIAPSILDAVAPVIIDRLYQQISDTAYAWGYEEFSDFLAGRYNGV